MPPRLLLALPAAPLPATGMDAAAALAELLGAQLFGLFVEDAELLGAAGLALARQLDVARRAWTAVSLEGLEEQFAARATALRGLLQRSAARSGVAAEFAVLRGERGALIEAHTAEGDYLVLFEPLPGRLGAAPAAAAGVIYVPPGARAGRGPVVAVVDSHTRRAALVAREIAQRAGQEVVLFDPVEEGKKLQWAAQRAAATGKAPRGAAAGGGRNDLLRVFPSPSLYVVSQDTLPSLLAVLPQLGQAARAPWLVLPE